MRNVKLILVGLLLTIMSGCGAPDAELVVYSARNEPLIKPMFDRFTEETGIKVVFVTDKAEVLMQRLQAEDSNTPADVLLTVDAGNLWWATQNDLLQPLESAVLTENIPEYLRDPEDRWFGLSVRARTIVYSPERADARMLSSYEGLADPMWRGRLCLRTSKKVYNQSLVAMLIAEHGEAKTEQIVKGWVANLAADVFANDTAVIEAIAAGQCDVGIVNTYYFGRLERDNPALPVKIFWANQGSGGVHVNVSGGGVVRDSRHVENATRLLEWLSAGEAQSMFASSNLEFPANPAIAADPAVAAWGEFEASRLSLARAGELQSAAVRLMDRAGYR
ncbi:MAG: extracellular solute-binding protein [Chromatiales bacterium]|nr:extracellular solute-binding protein [Chromatiales bacterium]